MFGLNVSSVDQTFDESDTILPNYGNGGAAIGSIPNLLNNKSDDDKGNAADENEDSSSSADDDELEDLHALLEHDLSEEEEQRNYGGSEGARQYLRPSGRESRTARLR